MTMHDSLAPLDRRSFLATSLAGSLAGPARPPARVCISLDLEMSRNFPTWEQTHWDYAKGNLDTPTKDYAAEAARRVKKQGGVVHFFAVGQVFEQPSVSWMQDLARAGHPIGNHTYDHVNVTATRPGDIQFRFHRAPWLIDGKKPAEVIRENVRLCSQALKSRVGVDPAGFRTPGGFAAGLSDRPDVRAMLRELGFWWVSSKYAGHPMGKAGEKPSREILDGIVQAQAKAQPFAYPEGLIEIPMSPPSDIVAFRTGKWKLEWFLETLDRVLDHILEKGQVFDFLGHPSCLYVVDPHFKAIDLICERVRKAGPRAQLTDLQAIAQSLRDQPAKKGP